MHMWTKYWTKSAFVQKIYHKIQSQKITKKNFKKSDLEQIFQCGCHQYFGKHCRERFTKKRLEPESKLYKHFLQTNLELKMVEQAENNNLRANKVI